MTTTPASENYAGPLSKAWAEEIRAIMARKQVSMREIARRLQVQPSWVSNRLKGYGPRTTPINANDMEAFAAALGVTWRDFLPDPARPLRESDAATASNVVKLPRLDSNQKPFDYTRRAWTGTAA